MVLILIFTSFLVVVFIILAYSTRTTPEQKIVRARLQEIQRSEKTADVGVETIDLSMQEKRGLLNTMSEHLQKYSFAQKLEVLFVQSGSSSSIGAFLATSVALAIAAGFLAHTFIGVTPLVIVATILGASARYASFCFLKARRLKALNTALPDVIELMSRALRAGHSMSSAIEIIVQQSVEPLAGEFATVYQQQRFGIPFRDALMEMSERVPSKDLRFLVTAILVQKETGGDLTEILDRTTHVIRERGRIEGEIRTYTAQGRLTGWILGLLPVIMLLIINIVTPGYSDVLFHDPVGQKMLYAGGTLIIIGGLIIRKIVDIQV